MVWWARRAPRAEVIRVKASEFVSTYANKGLAAWEAAAFEAARQGHLTPREWVPITLKDDAGNTAVIQVQEDVLGIGPKNDSIRLPLTPIGAQNIFNLYGWLLPTPWIVYQIWKNAPIKLTPTSIAALGEQNKGADLNQYYKHSQFLDRQIAGVLATTPQRIGRPEIVAGAKKHVVVDGAHYQPKKVLIFGWYHPSPDVFDDGRAMGASNRQPIQPISNLHGDFYVDYSHGVQAIHPIAIVNGVQMNTADLYIHPTLSKLVSSSPIKHVRYPSSVPVASFRPESASVYNVLPDVHPTVPGLSEYALHEIARRFGQS